MNHKQSKKRMRAEENQAAALDPATAAQKEKIARMIRKYNMHFEQKWDGITAGTAQAILLALANPALRMAGVYDLTDRKTVLSTKIMTKLESIMLNERQKELGDDFMWLEKRTLNDELESKPFAPIDGAI